MSMSDDYREQLESRGYVAFPSDLEGYSYRMVSTTGHQMIWITEEGILAYGRNPPMPCLSKTQAILKGQSDGHTRPKLLH